MDTGIIKKEKEKKHEIIQQTVDSPVICDFALNEHDTVINKRLPYRS